MNLLKYDGDQPVVVSKAEVRRWAQRIREDLRAIQTAIDNDDISALVDFAHDASGSAAELESIADATAAAR